MNVIDKDSLLRAIRCRLGVKSLQYATPQEKAIINEIKSAPTTEILHCQDCKYWRDLWAMCCIEYDLPRKRKPDDFCSRGERRYPEISTTYKCHKPQSLYYRAFCEEKEEESYCNGCEFWDEGEESNG